MNKSIIQPIKSHPWIFFFSAGLPFIVFTGIGISGILANNRLNIPYWAEVLARTSLAIFPTFIGILLGFCLSYIVQKYALKFNRRRIKIYAAIFLIFWNLPFLYLCFFCWGMGLGDHPAIDFSLNNFLISLSQIVFICFPLEGVAVLIFTTVCTTLVILAVESIRFLLTRYFLQQKS